MNLSLGQIFSNMESDMETALEEMANSPSADVANRSRECMAEVMRVVKSSKNLKGTSVKTLKHAAVVGAASIEVLHTRVDKNETDNEAFRQVKALRKELDSVKRDAQTAREEVVTLRKELEAARAATKRGNRRRAKMFEDDEDDGPPSQATNRERANHGSAENAAGTTPPTEDIQIMEDTGAETPVPTEYDDERRKREIMPPPSEYPPVIRPAIRGRIKVLEDRPVKEYKVRPAGSRERSANRGDTEGGGKGEAQSFTDQITPLLEEWFREKLLSLGPPTAPMGAARQRNVQQKRPQKGRRRGRIPPLS